LENPKSNIKNNLKDQFDQRFPSGLFLVMEDTPYEIDRFLNERLVKPLDQVSRQGLWGPEAQKISETGKWLGWVPSHTPFLFFADTVIQEIANGFAMHLQKAEGGEDERNKAEVLLKKMKFCHLAQRNPYTLSQGESKIIWFLTQWAKKPDYLIVSDFKAGLSDVLLDRLISFIKHHKKESGLQNNITTVILGFGSDEKSWAQNLENEDWHLVSGFLDKS